MKKNSRLNNIWLIVEAVLLLTLGILTIVYANNQDAWNAIGYITGVLILVDGLLRLTVFVLTRAINISKVGLYRGIAEVTFGTFLLIRPEIVVSYFTLLIAIALVVIGLTCVIECVIYTIRKALPKGSLVFAYAGALLVLVLGIVALIYYPYNIEKAGGTNTISILLISIGILFSLSALAILVMLLVNNKKERKNQVIEGEEITKARSKEREAKQKK